MILDLVVGAGNSADSGRLLWSGTASGGSRRRLC